MRPAPAHPGALPAQRLQPEELHTLSPGWHDSTVVAEGGCWLGVKLLLTLACCLRGACSGTATCQ